MAELVMGVFFAIAVAVGFYLALEFFATESALRQIGKPVSGVESAKGRQVTVISVFEQGSDGANPEGRIRMMMSSLSGSSRQLLDKTRTVSRTVDGAAGSFAIDTVLSALDGAMADVTGAVMQEIGPAGDAQASS